MVSADSAPLFDDAGDAAPEDRQGRLFLDLAGYEGPLDVLLTLAREQKVDVAKISILELAEQYLAFIETATRLRLEVAAEYLVMAAWLAYLKSRLLLPQRDAGGEEPTPAEMAAALAFHLQRLEAMQHAGRRLMQRPQLYAERFPRGAPEAPPTETSHEFTATLFDLLSAYGAIQVRGQNHALRIEPTNLYSMEDALHRLADMLGRMPAGIDGWTDLARFLPDGLLEGLALRSAIAATFTAGLEMARSGAAELRQERAFGPIQVRPRRAKTQRADNGPRSDDGR